MGFEMRPGDIREQLLESQRGWHPLRKVVDPLEGRLEDVVAREQDGWLVLTCIAHPDWPGPPRAVGFVVVPKDPTAIPAGGLTVNGLRRMITGMGDVLAEWLTNRFAHSAIRAGDPQPGDAWSRQTRKAVEDALAQRPNSTTKRGFGDGFYARVARDAVGAGRAGKLVLAALNTKYLKSDPRPPQRRSRPIKVEMIKTWIHTARHDYRFLPEAQPGHGVWAPTPELVAFEEGRGSTRRKR